MRVPPNQYFKTGGKNSLLNTKRMTESTLFEDRGPTGRIPKGSRGSFVEAAVKEAKGKLAPTHYPVDKILKGYNSTRDNTGKYQKGIVKAGMEQLQFINDVKVRAKDSPDYYKPSYVSTFLLLLCI